MVNNPCKTIFLSLLVICVLPISAHAENSKITDRSHSQSEDKNWNFEAGVGVMYEPTYEGSENYEAKAVPVLSVEYKNGLFFAGIFDGIGSYFIQDENYKVGASIGFSFGRDEDDDENLRGLGDIDMGTTANLIGEYSFGPWQISGKITKGSEDYGTTATLEIGTIFSLSDHLMVMLTVGPTWTDSDHMNSYFGVSSAQSERSGYDRFEVKSGFKSVGFSANVFYDITEHWNIKLMVNFDKLLGDAADSPITGEDINPSVFSIISYNF